LHLNAKSWFFF